MHSQHYASRATNLREFPLLYSSGGDFVFKGRGVGVESWRFGWGLCQDQKLLMRRGVKCVFRSSFLPIGASQQAQGKTCLQACCCCCFILMLFELLVVAFILPCTRPFIPKPKKGKENILCLFKSKGYSLLSFGSCPHELKRCEPMCVCVEMT